MRRSALLLVGELTKALFSAAHPPSHDAGSAVCALAAAAGSTALTAGKRAGRITEWDPFERHGVIVDDDGGRRYRVANTRAFETVLPTMLRTLEGAAVEFDVDRRPTADRVIIRNRLTPITAESYRQRPPVDFLSPEMLSWAGPRTAASKSTTPSGARATTTLESSAATAAVAADRRGKGDGQVEGEEELFAKNIVVDVSSIPATQVARWSGPLSEEAVIKPTKNIKDMRSSRVFDAETNAYLRLQRQLGSSEEAQRVLAKRQEMAAATAVRREVVAAEVHGVILAWSGIHRSGLVREGAEPPAAAHTTAPAAAATDEALCIVRNVSAFQSALPTSQSLQHRRVVFTKVSYSNQPRRFFAEEIVVVGDVRYDAAVSSLEEAHAARERERAALLQRRSPGAMIMQEDETAATSRTGGAAADAEAAAPSDADHPPVDPDAVLYGVLVRWSGGQGVVEAGDGRHFFLRSAAEFEQLVERTSPHLRGAVVQFSQDVADPRYACRVRILSTATSSAEEVRPLLEKTWSSRGDAAASEVPDGCATAAAAARTASAVLPDGMEWTHGTLLSWSSAEGQGIIVGDAGQELRYVLRDPEETVVDYAARQALLRKGRRVKFTAFGSTGRLACNVVLLETEVEEEALAQEELRPAEPRLSMDGNMNEAIPSPMSTGYWLNRMDKAGYDTKEVKEMQNRALRLDEDDDEGDGSGTAQGKLLDSEELLKKDHWWSDPRKNVRFPNSDMTAGHLALIGPASMMNVAMKAKDPKRLDKMLRKYQSRLTEDQKEYAWKQAKEMAPKYEECVRKGRERNEEPTFHFF
ncbi:hypothetical protein NESM_000808000 [Novymonas esmeraldas]|uniref:Uncharacterized protein n=1 Tax=Novymonas esmeraldas TaxID=1808958 RepID=A0AAW0EZP3_9TRYP